MVYLVSIFKVLRKFGILAYMILGELTVDDVSLSLVY
jgi:hypothetical protein